MMVFVYKNLQRGDWSVKSLKTKRVVAHLPELALHNCTFKVSEAGRQRVLRTKHKNVHAGVVGQWWPNESPSGRGVWVKVHYDPYHSGDFFSGNDERKFSTAKFVRFTPEGCFVVTY